MIIAIEAETENHKGGVFAQAKRIKLGAHGVDQDEAVESLRRLIEVWCRALSLQGRLEDTLRRRRIAWEPDGEGIEVRVRTVGEVRRGRGAA